ncbi:MAG TPA: ABC transporter permease [Acidimicrobiales bacterium]|nr:ABC transporter permease [Acidimicrobiales bacterium]
MSVDLTEEAQPPTRRGPRRRQGRGAASFLVLIFALITLNFLLPRAMPGDPIDALLAQGSAGFTLGDQSRAALEEYYGLDGSLASQYGDYLVRLAQGDLGRSIVTNVPVRQEIAKQLPWTILLIGSSILVSTVLGLVAGVHSGWRRDRPLDRALMTVLLTVREFPTFLLGSLLLFLFAVKLGWLPLFGARTPFSDSYSLVEKVVDIGSHLLLPLVVLTIGLTVGNYLVMRAGMVSELGSDHLQLGRVKGLRQRRLKYRYAARNALLPVVSVTGLQLGFALTGDVLVERVFSYPGLGSLLFESINVRDYPVIQGGFLVISVGVVSVNALTDLLYRRLDPRMSP